jgi:hypothetical protein
MGLIILLVILILVWYKYSCVTQVGYFAQST